MEQPVEHGAYQEEEAEKMKKVAVPFLPCCFLMFTAQSFFSFGWSSTVAFRRWDNIASRELVLAVPEWRACNKLLEFSDLGMKLMLLFRQALAAGSWDDSFSNGGAPFFSHGRVFDSTLAKVSRWEKAADRKTNPQYHLAIKY